MDIFIGKEIIELRTQFFEEPFVKSLIDDFINSSDDPDRYKEQLTHVEFMGSLVVHAVHGDHVTVLPHSAVNLGYSDRSPNEIWRIDNRVLAIQSHPEFNSNYIEELIINKMYDVGKLNDMQKDEVLERINDNQLLLTRNVLNMIVFSFIYQ